MITLGQAIYYLKGDKSDLKQTLDSAEKDTQTSSGKIKGFLSNAFAFATGGAILGFLGSAKDAIGGVVGAMVGGNSEFETYNTQFKTLLGSAGAAKDRMAELSKFGAETPFELPDVVKADMVLQNFGFHADNVKDKFGFTASEIQRLAGDAASGVHIGFDEMAGYLGKFASGSTGEVISRFQELGIVTKTQLTEMGLAFDKNGSLIINSQAEMDNATGILMNAIQSKYGGMMAQQSQTMEGMVSNLSDWKSNTLRIIGAPIFEVLKDKLGILLEFLSNPETQAAITAFATMLADGIGTAMEWLSTVAIPALIDGWNTIAPAVGVVIAVISQVIAAFQSGGEGSQELAGVMSFLGQTFGTVKDIITLAVQVIQAIVVPIIGFITQFINDNQTEILHIVQNVWSAMQITIGAALNLIKGILTAVMQALNGDWSGAWKTIQDTCASFVLAIVELIRLQWDNLVTIFGGLVTAALAKMTELKNGVVTKFNEIVSAAQSKVGEFVSIGANIVAGIRQGFADQWDSFLGWIQRQIDKIPKAVRDALGIHSPSTVMWELGAPIIDGLTGGMLARLPNLLAGVKKVTESVLEQFRSIQSKIQNILGDMFGSKASFMRTMSSNTDFVASLREGMDDYRKLSDDIFEGLETRTDLAAQIDALNAKNAALSPEDRIANQEKINKLQAEYAENEAKIAENQIKLRNETEQRGKLNQLASDTQGLLAAATADAKQYADPREAAAFLALRSNQIKEMATLQKELILAKDATEREDIQKQIELIKAAQEADLAQFSYKQQAGGNGDDLRDLVIALNKLVALNPSGGQAFNLSIFGQTIDGQDVIQGYETLRAAAGVRT